MIPNSFEGWKEWNFGETCNVLKSENLIYTRLHPQGKGGPEGTSCVRRHQISLIRFMTWQSKILSKSFYYRFWNLKILDFKISESVTNRDKFDHFWSNRTQIGHIFDQIGTHTHLIFEASLHKKPLRGKNVQFDIINNWDVKVRICLIPILQISVAVGTCQVTLRAASKVPCALQK